jgi:hypothetical protein
MKFCPQCGAEISETAKFCTSCGYQIQSQQEAPPPPPETPAPEPQPVYDQAKQATNVFTEAVTGKTNLIQRVINILVRPKTEWQVIDNEQPNTMKLLAGYVFVLALIPAVALFIRYGIIGYLEYGRLERSIGEGISRAIIMLLGTVASTYIFAYIIDLLASSFESEKSIGKSLQLATYSLTPIWVLGILYLFGTSGSLFFFLGALYSLYLLYTGIPILKKTPSDKVVGYMIISLIAYIVIYFVLALILGLILGLFIVSGSGFRAF